MDYKLFKDKLKELGLNIKKFSELNGLSSTTLPTTWKTKDKAPQWAVTWLGLYEKAKKYDEIVDKIKDKE